MTACDGRRLVEQAERTFLQGSFRRALSLANQCLNQHHHQNSQDSPVDTLPPNRSLENETETTLSSFNFAVIPLQTIVYFPKRSQTVRGGKASVEQIPFQLWRVHFWQPPTFAGGAALSPAQHPSSSFSLSSLQSRRQEETTNHPPLLRHVSPEADRAAAIALQSWYELFSLAVASTTSGTTATMAPLPSWQPTSTTRTATTTTTTLSDLLAQGFDYLQPFLQVYSSSSSSATAASLELTVVFIFFCHAVGLTSEARELALELVHRIVSVSSSSSSSFPHGKDASQFHGGDDDDGDDQPKKREKSTMTQRCLRELLEFLLVQQLPYFTLTKSVIDFLRCLQESEYKSPFDSNGTRRPFWPADASSQSKMMNLDAVHEIVQFLEHPPVHWPEDICQTVLVDVRRKLEQQLQLFWAWHQQQQLYQLQQQRLKNQIQNHALAGEASVTPTAPSSTMAATSSRSILQPKSWWDVTTSFPRRWKLVMERLCALTVSRLSKSNNNTMFDPRAGQKSESPYWQHGAKAKTAIIAVASLWLLWKHRRRLFEAIYNHLRLLAGLIRQPIQEILEAVL